MIKHVPFLIFISVFFCVDADAQKLKKADKEIISRISQHVSYLADDKLEGRRAGTEGEKLAADYISNQFKAAGDSPKGTEGRN